MPGRMNTVPFKSTYSFFTLTHKKFTERFKHFAISVCLLKHQFGSGKKPIKFCTKIQIVQFKYGTTCIQNE